MHDHKTEIMKIKPLAALDFDDDGDNTVEVVNAPTTETTETTEASITRKIWDYVKLHPGCSVHEITHNVPSADPAGVSTRLNQLMRRGLITRSISPVTGKHVNHVATDEYVSMSKEDRMTRMREGRAAWVKQQQTRKAKREAKAKAKMDKYMRVPAPEAAPTPVPTPVPVAVPTSMSDVDLFVSQLTVGDARNLYDALKRVFFS